MSDLQVTRDKSVEQSLCDTIADLEAEAEAEIRYVASLEHYEAVHKSRIAKLEADNDSLRNTIISMQLSLKSDGERIAKLEGALNWFRFNSSPEGMGRAIEALEEVDDGS